MENYLGGANQTILKSPINLATAVKSGVFLCLWSKNIYINIIIQTVFLVTIKRAYPMEKASDLYFFYQARQTPEEGISEPGRRE